MAITKKEKGLMRRAGEALLDGRIKDGLEVSRQLKDEFYWLAIASNLQNLEVLKKIGQAMIKAADKKEGPEEKQRKLEEKLERLEEKLDREMSAEEVDGAEIERLQEEIRKTEEALEEMEEVLESSL